LLTIPLLAGEASPPVLWDLERYIRIALLDGHRGRAYSARWADRRQVLTAGADGTARLWDGDTGRGISVLHGYFPIDAAVTPDGTMIVAGGVDGVLWFWDRENGRPLWTLQAHRARVAGLHFEGDDIVTRGSDGSVSRWTLPELQRVVEQCGSHAACVIVPP
jgi:WD40 repeat protein